MTTYRDAGFLAEAFRNFLALLGWSPGGEREIFTLDELIEKFSLDGIHRSNAVFNFKENDPRHWTDDKAIWMNAEYIRTMPLADLLPHVKNELKSAKLWREEYEEEDREWYERTVDLMRARFFTLKDFSSQGRAYFSEDFDFDPAAVAKNLNKFPDLREWLPQLADRFESVFSASHHNEVQPPATAGGTDSGLPYTEENIEAVVKAFTEEKGTKLGVIMNGARTLLTGVAVGPSMLSVFEVVGLERTLMRLRSQVAWNS